MEQNKKTLMLSLVAVLVLVGSVIGVAYAMFSFSAAGTQTNVIQTGYVSINYAHEDTIGLTSALPVSDDIGAQSTDENAHLTFDVTATINGVMRVNYDLAIDDTSFVQGSNLTTSYIKIRLQKSTDGGTNWTDEIGSATTGVTIASLASASGEYASSVNTNIGGTAAGTGVTSYALDSEYFENTSTTNSYTGTVKYKLTAWVASDFTLTAGQLNKDESVEGQVTQSQGTTPETFSFKVKVVAGQANAQ